MKHIFPDSYPLSLLCNPKPEAEVVAITQWAREMQVAGHRLYLPEIINYELRRELIRADKQRSLNLLNALTLQLTYLPLDTETMLRAAELWAWARKNGIPTADPKKLDIDVILVAQVLKVAELEGVAMTDLVIATSNVAHLSRFVPAKLWREITT